MKLYITHSLSAWTGVLQPGTQCGCSCVQGRVSDGHSLDHQDPWAEPSALILPVSASTLSLSPASVLFFNYARCLPHKQQCVFNLRPIIHLPWFCSQQEKNTETENCLYFTGSIFPISPLSTPSRTEPPGRHIMCLNTFCVCVCESMDRCVYIISQLSNNGFNFPTAKSYEWWDRWREGDRDLPTPRAAGWTDPPPPFWWHHTTRPGPD